MNVPLHRDPLVITMGTMVLRSLDESVRSLTHAIILTDDGFEVAAIVASETGRMASMSSSMQALGDAVVRELRIGSNDYIVVAAENGHVIQLRVPGHPLVLSAQFGTSATVGNALTASRRTASSLADLLTVATQ